ncbi:hypothetical protein KY320_03045 [Candidatus Woesearchaeota archaeon]|nr:hypothetical protein [Candidatus Woesearchaeota archaeon]
MPRGRPAESKIRDNIAEILYLKGRSHGYEIYRIYIAVFPKVTLRSIYYQLRRGADIGIFKVEDVVNEQGDFSWGESAKKTYYSLGAEAKPRANNRVKEYIDSLKLSEES